MKVSAARCRLGQWVRAMHEPFRGGLLDRLRDAVAVLSGRAFAVRWPRDGEFEQALVRTEQRKVYY